MSLRLEIRTRAYQDLRAIVLFIARRNGDLISATRFGERLLDRSEALLTAPGMGSPYFSRRGIRKLNEGAYKIFYQVSGEKVVILRIWDGRRGHDPAL